MPGSTNDTVVSAGTQTVFGTPGYMAPEVLTGGESSPASDVYALGVMLYECLAGHRPYDGPSLIEVMARVIDGAERPARLDDELADLVDRMLAHDPSMRPKLADVARELAPAAAPVPRPPSRRWPLVAVAIAGLGLGTVAVWRLTRDEVAPVASPMRAPMAVAVEPIAIKIASYGSQAPTPSAIADVIAILIGEINGNEVVGPAELFAELKIPLPKGGEAEPSLPADQVAAAERKLGVRHVVRGAIEERTGRLHARLEVVAVGGGPPTIIEQARPSAEIAELMNDLAEQIARVGDPGATLDRTPNVRRARVLTGRGEASLAENKFFNARPYLEQAVIADPRFFDAWNALATTRAWMFAPEADVVRAIDTARDLAPEGDLRQLLRGASQYLHHDPRGALATLSPLEASTALNDRERRDLLYYIGEIHWHEGEHATGVAFFRRALERDSTFMPAMIHPMQHALARRDAAEARRMIDLQRSVDTEAIDFALGRLESLASGTSQWAIQARLVLGQPLSPELEAAIRTAPIDGATYRLARAVEMADPAAARRAIEDMWKFIDAPGRGEVQPSEYFSLQVFGEVVLCAGLSDEARRLEAFLAKRSTVQQATGHPRLALLTAALVGDRSLIVRSDLSTRNARLADAVEAELDGNRARAVELLGALVADPSPYWDFPERAALLRNLRALGRTAEATALCTDTMRPALFRYAVLAMKRACP